MTSPIKILIHILEDELIAKEVIVKTINENPIFHADGFSDIEQFKTHLTKDVSLVITDFRIGNQNAIDTIMWVRLNFPGTHIIVMSAYFTEEIFIKLIRCRVSDVVKKDGAYWIDNLIAAIETLVPEITTKVLSLSDDNI